MKMNAQLSTAKMSLQLKQLRDFLPKGKEDTAANSVRHNHAPAMESHTTPHHSTPAPQVWKSRESDRLDARHAERGMQVAVSE